MVIVAQVMAEKALEDIVGRVAQKVWLTLDIFHGQRRVAKAVDIGRCVVIACAQAAGEAQNHHHGDKKQVQPHPACPVFADPVFGEVFFAEKRQRQGYCKQTEQHFHAVFFSPFSPGLFSKRVHSPLAR